MEKIIEAKNVSIHYGQTEAVQNVSFIIQKGDFIGLAGPNGSGKSTLVKAILGLEPLSAGELLLFNKPHEQSPDFFRIGYLPQRHSSINSLFPASVNEVIFLGLLSNKKFPKIVTKEDREKIREVMEVLNIIHLKDKMLSELSGGQQQRVFLARALVSKPELLIFDEPSTALDPDSRNQFFEILNKLNKKDGITIILITHDTGYIGEFANKLLYLDRKVVFFGKIDDYCPSGEVGTCFEKHGKHIIWHQHN